MGRRRTAKFRHLPERMYLRRGTYYFRAADRTERSLGRDYGAALAQYATLVGDQFNGRTVGDLIDKYRVEVLPTKRSAATRADNAAGLDRLKRTFGHMSPGTLTRHMMTQYRDRRRTKDGKPAPVAARHEVQLLHHVLNVAVDEWGLLTANPIAGAARKKRGAGTKRARVTADQVAAVRALANQRTRVAIDLAVCTGQRQGDLLSLKREQLTDEGIVFRQSKTGAAVLIEWSDELRAIIARANALKPQIPRDYVLRTRRGKPYSRSGFGAIWQRLMAKHVAAGGQRFTFHDLRSVSADAADTVEEARDRLGHASATTTLRHYRRAPRKAKPAS